LPPEGLDFHNSKFKSNNQQCKMTESTKVLTLIIGMEIKTYEDLKISANEGNTLCYTTE
jgi:hypothetical protein